MVSKLNKTYKNILLKHLLKRLVTFEVFFLFLGFFLITVNEVFKYGVTYNIKLIIAFIASYLFILLMIIIVYIKEKKQRRIIEVNNFNINNDGITVNGLKNDFFEFYYIYLWKVTKDYLYIALVFDTVYVIDISSKSADEKKELKKFLKKTVKKSKYKEKKGYKFILADIVLVMIVISSCVNLYNTCTDPSSKIYYYTDNFFNRKTIEFTNNNIYETGIKGILDDIEKELDLPSKLYVSDSFDVEFNSSGRIIAVNGIIYGKDDNDQLESFLIEYDTADSEKIIVRLKGMYEGNYNDNYLLQPLIDIVNVVDLKSAIEEWPDDNYEIVYSGVKNVGYNNEGVIYIDSEGNTRTIGYAFSEIEGYMVSLHIPWEDETYKPYRYILVDSLYDIPAEKYTAPDENEKINSKIDYEYNYTDDIIYALVAEDAAAGSRFYSLYRSEDAGTSWDIVNEDPFLGEGGGAGEITFINDNLGFISLSKSGGASAELFRTEDGGVTYEKVEIPDVDIGIDIGNPYDYPSMPYKEDNKLLLEVGQGSDGDYNGGKPALFESEDEGITWKLVEK